MLPELFAAQPPLPDGFDWPGQTRVWWRMWASAPQASSFTVTDWDFLLDTALLHARVWGPEPQLSWLPELRLRVAKFGATPEDRARLRMQFAQAVEAEAKTPAVPARERYASLQAVR